MNDETRTTLAAAVARAVYEDEHAWIDGAMAETGEMRSTAAMAERVLAALFAGPVPLAYPADTLEQVGMRCLVCPVMWRWNPNADCESRGLAPHAHPIEPVFRLRSGAET